MEATTVEFLKYLVGGLAAGLTVGTFLSVKSKKQQNGFHNSGTINVTGDNSKINSDNTNVTNVTNVNNTTVNKSPLPARRSHNNGGDDDASAMIIIAFAAMVGAVYGLFWHFEKIELAVYAVSILMGTAGSLIAITRYRNDTADQYVMCGSLIFAIAGIVVAPEAIGAMKASLVPEAREMIARQGVFKFMLDNPKYIQYVVLQFIGLITTTAALTWQVFFAYKQRTLADNVLGYTIPVVVGSLSYFALTGGLYRLLNGQL